MGYYENPPIISPGEGYNAITAGILSGSKALAQGFMLRGERIREREKEDRLTIQKLQDQKNKTDLHYNSVLSDWKKKHDKVGGGVDEQITTMVQQKIQDAADAQIALTQESDKDKRKGYLKLISDADVFMNNASEVSKRIAMESATWRESSAISIGVPGGWAINGSKEQIKQRRAALEITGGLDGLYENTTMNVKEDGTGTGFNIEFTGRVKGEAENFKPITINSSSYLKADSGGTGGFLSKVEGLDDFIKISQKEVLDNKGKLLEGLLQQKRETVDLPPQKGSSGRGIKDVYQIVEGQRLQTDAIKSKIKEAAEIKATGYLKADKQQSLSSLLEYTLKKEPGFYEDEFLRKETGVDVNGKKTYTNRTVEEQKTMLTDLLTEYSFSKITDNSKYTEENGEKVYWSVDSKVEKKEKPTAASLEGGGLGKQPPTTYQEDYFNEIISGYTPRQGEDLSVGQKNYATRSTLAKNLNKLSGKADKYITKEELFKLYKAQPFVKQTSRGPVNTNMTIEEAYKEGKVEGDIDKAFTSRFGNSYLYGKEGEGAYKAVKDYNINKAVDRIKLALDQTTDAGEKKMLQGKLKDAKLKDWTESNPRKENETLEQYYARATKSN
jgi:hypothetical protein